MSFYKQKKIIRVSFVLNFPFFIVYIFIFLLFTGRVGCPHYMAPEIISRRIFGKACDVWGAGVMLHVLLSGRLPFLGSGKRLQDSIAKGRIIVSFVFDFFTKLYLSYLFSLCIICFSAG